MTRSIKKWSEEADAKLHDCFASTYWNMFQDSSNGIEKYTTSVICFINKCIDDVVPTVTVHTCPNQKPWITGNICTELRIELPLSRSGTLTLTLVINPAILSNKPSNGQALTQD